MKPILKIIISIFVCASVLNQPVWAEDNDDLIKKMKFCKSLKIADERLRCFEVLVPVEGTSLSSGSAISKPFNSSLKKGQTKSETESLKDIKEPVLKKIKQDKVKKKQQFGAEHISKPKKYIKEDENFTFKVIKTSQNRNGLYFFYMENGQVWRQLESQRVFFPKDRVFTVVMNHGAFGDYKMKIEGKGRQTRVKRVK